jgi:hypothetical protein
MKALPVRWIFACLLLAAPLLALGAAPVKDAESFRALKQVIEAGLLDTGVYGKIRRNDRDEVNAALERMETLFEKASSTAQMDKADKVALYNDQELVNNILTDAKEGYRDICRFERTTGSHRMGTKCQTVREIRELREKNRVAVNTKLKSHLRFCDIPGTCKKPRFEP